MAAQLEFSFLAEQPNNNINDSVRLFVVMHGWHPPRHHLCLKMASASSNNHILPAREGLGIIKRSLRVVTVYLLASQIG